MTTEASATPAILKRPAFTAAVAAVVSAVVAAVLFRVLPGPVYGWGIIACLATAA